MNDPIQTERKAWTTPVLRQLSVDLDAIANGNGVKNEINKANTNKS